MIAPLVMQAKDKLKLHLPVAVGWHSTQRTPLYEERLANLLMRSDSGSRWGVCTQVSTLLWSTRVGSNCPGQLLTCMQL
jgi:hypothetical protein